jgi:formylglycine-generating enzyme required for sulfatase activity
MFTMKPLAASLIAILSAVALGAQAAAPVTLEQLLVRAGTYVVEFKARFVSVVAEERYEQIAPASTGRTGIPVTHRRLLRSDFLLVKVPSDDAWLPFRDVFEVDGKPVRDRQDRLTRLFLQPAPTAIEQAEQIVADSARYNIGGVQRNINLPLFGLNILEPANQRRFRFSHLEDARKIGPGVWSIAFEEVASPTLIHGNDRADIKTSGRFWLDASTGRIVRIEISASDNGMRATITTDYRFDPAFGLNVPAEMREQYIRVKALPISGVATYSRFRRFDVQVDETIVDGVPGMVEIPAGRFAMGSPPSEASRNADETRHEVTISRTFLVGRHEVTQQEWKAVMGTTPSFFRDCGPACPVESVSFDEVQQFLDKLNATTQPMTSGDRLRYRLPTESEWEYACRAGTTTPFSTGENLTTEQANYNGAHPYAAFPKGPNREQPTPTGTFPPNPWGLADVHGNVWEWTSDWYAPYSTGPATDPRGPAIGTRRVIRGGSWYFDANSARCALRYTHAPHDRGFSVGFRLAADRIPAR